MHIRSIAAFVVAILLGTPTSAQVIRPGFLGPNGEKKVGTYVWVWHTESFSKGQSGTVEADCPIGYAVLGGGYQESENYTISHTTPNEGFDGWIIDAGGGPYGNVVTVYASCAPV